jgi:hypothetical protein
MSFVEIYLFVSAGVVVSIVLPILRGLLPKPKAARVAGVWPILKPYVVVGAFSLLTGLLIVALLGDAMQDWRAAVLAGYAWDSTLQKVAA